MTERIRKLREKSQAAIPSISTERASLLCDFFEKEASRGVSIPVQRALAFRYLLENKSLYIDDGELIVGERGPFPKATPTYPEICLHSLEDLEMLDSRPKMPYKVDEQTRQIYRQRVIPYFSGRSIRERIFQEVSPEWRAAYEAGIFTEFLEQRAPGHTVLGDKIYRQGFLQIKQEIAAALAGLDFFHDPDALDKREELKAMDIAADALIAYAGRQAEKLRELAAGEPDPKRKQELEEMAAICHRVPAQAPQTFHEALQYYWFVHIGVISELNPWDSFSPGRLDQHLYPFYRREIDQGTLATEQARELLQTLWIKFNNHPAPPKTGVTAKESNTYTDFALINLGGLKPDGSDGVNDLTYLILEVIEEMRLLQPSAMIQVSKKNPDQLLKKALAIIKTGYGQPSVFNADAIIQELTNQGKTLADARRGGASGCVETGAFGTECYILTGYFNLAKVLEITLYNGLDPRTGQKTGIDTGELEGFQTFDDLMAAFEKQLRHFIDIKIAGNNIIARLYAQYLPVPFLSLLIDDCIGKSKDYNAGGARYNTRYIQGVGLGSLTDSLASIRFHLFDHRTLTAGELLDMLRADFSGYESYREKFVHHTPKYGNDDDYADDIARRVFEIFFRAVDGRPTSTGGTHHIDLLPTTCHVYFGGVIGALPDGRRAHLPLSEGISPVQGSDRQGPTAVLKSAGKIDHLRTGGTLLNQKFTPQILQDETGIQQVLHLIRAYFKLDGHHIQFNVIDAATLREARKNPEQYRDLIVRVAGYSDYFVQLTDELQEEIISRTGHQAI